MLVRMRVMGVVDDHEALVGDVDLTPVRGRQLLGGEDLVRWARRDDLPREQEDVVGDVRLGDVVRREHDRATVGPLLLEDGDDPVLGGQVETGGGLVKEEEVAVLSESLRDVDPLTLARGELAEVSALEVGDAQPFHRFGDGAPVLVAERPEGTALRVPAHRHDLPDRDRQDPVRGGLLQDVGDAAAHGARTAPEHTDRACPGAGQPADRPEQGRLPRSVRADDRGDRPRGDGDRLRPEGDVVPVREDEVTRVDRDLWVQPRICCRHGRHGIHA